MNLTVFFHTANTPYPREATTVLGIAANSNGRFIIEGAELDEAIAENIHRSSLIRMPPEVAAEGEAWLEALGPKYYNVVNIPLPK